VGGVTGGDAASKAEPVAIEETRSEVVPIVPEGIDETIDMRLLCRSVCGKSRRGPLLAPVLANQAIKRDTAE